MLEVKIKVFRNSFGTQIQNPGGSSLTKVLTRDCLSLSAAPPAQPTTSCTSPFETEPPRWAQADKEEGLSGDIAEFQLTTAGTPDSTLHCHAVPGRVTVRNYSCFNDNGKKLYITNIRVQNKPWIRQQMI